MSSLSSHHVRADVLEDVHCDCCSVLGEVIGVVPHDECSQAPQGAAVSRVHPMAEVRTSSLSHEGIAPRDRRGCVIT